MSEQTNSQEARPRIGFMGQRFADSGATVWMTINGARHELPMRLDLRSHSPSGPEWGYLGSGPAQLALAVCAQLVDEETALYVYQGVKESLIARIPQRCAWTLTERQVRDAIAAVLQARGDAAARR